MYELPNELCGLKIRTDYRVVLDIITALNDSELSEFEKAFVTVQILYENWEEIEDLEEAMKQAYWFINVGEINISELPKPKIMDWDHDFKIIVASINRVIGQEVRAMEYLHWWTFMSAYYEIGEGVFSHIINIRSKKQKGKQLEQYEKEFYAENKTLVDLKTKYSIEEQEEIDRLEKLLGGNQYG